MSTWIRCRCRRDVFVHKGLRRERPSHCECGAEWYFDHDACTYRPTVYDRKPALFVDLDGTVRKSKSGAKFGPIAPDDVELLPNVETTLRAYRERGYYIVAVSNQGVVAFGSKTHRQVVEILEATEACFEGESPIDQIQISTTLPRAQHGKVEPHDRVSLSRKPNYGMLATAERDAIAMGVVIDFERAIMTGDRPEDEACARAAGISFEWAWDFFGWERETPAIVEAVFATLPADGSTMRWREIVEDSAIARLVGLSDDRQQRIKSALHTLRDYGRAEMNEHGWHRILGDVPPHLGPLYPVERGGQTVNVLVIALTKPELDHFARHVCGTPVTTSIEDRHAIWARAFLQPRCARAQAAIWCSAWPTLAARLAQDEDAFDKVLERLAAIDTKSADVASVWCRAAHAAERHFLGKRGA